jgi:tetratricopeptide (TPR) repeat protein
MCAECHSTDLQVNYDLASDRFATTWSEINVGCEACHGPASNHVAEARTGNFSSDWGLSVDLDDHGRSVWQMNPQTGIAERSEPATRQSKQPEACGRCHARRGVISPTYEYGKPLAETHRVALLDAPLYFDDGQIRDEVYVYGSFVQSRMYRAGVTCSDCHNPHSLELVTGSEPSDVCTQCHLPDKFASTEHHNHEPDDVVCVDCHMPSRDYMVVDPRRDHSFRVPRPDLSVNTDVPNACNNCHTEQSTEWAAAAAQDWWDEARPLDSGIARATALTLLTSPLVSKDAAAIQRAFSDADALVRMAALQSARMLPIDTQLQLAAPLLKDSVRSVRIEAASLLSPVSDNLPSTAGFAEAAKEFQAAQLAIASRPEAHASLGDFSASLGNAEQAIDHYETALRMDPTYSMSRLNYADALRRFGDEQGAERLLREGLVLDAESAEIHHSLGLLLVRSNRSDDGLAELREAARLSPQNARFAYVEGIALNSLGQSDEAIEVLEDAHRRFGRDFDIAWALATMLRDRGDTARAIEVVEKLAGHRPDDPNVAALLVSLTVP